MPDARVRYRVWTRVSRVTNESRPIGHWLRDADGRDRKLDLAQAHALARALTRQHAASADVFDGEVEVAWYTWDARKKIVVEGRRQE